MIKFSICIELFIYIISMYIYIFSQFLITESKTRIFAAFLEMLQWFAGHQIRNVAVRIISFVGQ